MGDHDAPKVIDCSLVLVEPGESAVQVAGMADEGMLVGAQVVVAAAAEVNESLKSGTEAVHSSPSATASVQNL